MYFLDIKRSKVFLNNKILIKKMSMLLIALKTYSSEFQKLLLSISFFTAHELLLIDLFFYRSFHYSYRSNNNIPFWNTKQLTSHRVCHGIRFARWLFLSHFCHLLRWASFFEGDGAVIKNCFSLKPNHHYALPDLAMLSLSKSVV